jgi:DNA-binding LacI/PurR family transcriptional regulator
MERSVTPDEDELFRQLAFGERRRLEVGRSYLVKERKPGKAWEMFAGAIDDGFEGLYVTRQHPNHVEKRHGPKSLKVVWLSTTLGRDYVDPHNLSALTALINGFAEAGRRTIILLDGLEYLRINNDEDRIIKFVEYLNEIVMQRQSVLVLSVDDRAFESKEMALIERNSVLVE